MAANCPMQVGFDAKSSLIHGGMATVIRDVSNGVVLAWIIRIIDKPPQIVRVSAQLRTSWVVPQDHEPTCIQ